MKRIIKKSLSLVFCVSMLLCMMSSLTFATTDTEPHVCEYVTTVKPASDYIAGSVITACSICGDVQSSEDIPKIDAVSLSCRCYYYSGKTKTPIVTLKDSNGTSLTKSVDYDVVYSSGRKNVGRYLVTITLKGRYEGTIERSFRIMPKTVLTSVTAGSKKMTVKSNMKLSATGGSTFQISYRLKGSKTWKHVTTTSQSKTISNLKKGKTYEVRMRAYKIVKAEKYIGDGTHCFVKIK